MNSGSDINRLLAALNHQKADRTPNFEIVIDKRSLSHILGKQVDCSLPNLPPADALEAALRVGQDAIPCAMSHYAPNSSIRSRTEPRKLIFPDYTSRREKLRVYLNAVRGTGVGVVAQMTGPLTPSYMGFGETPIQDFMLLLYDDEEFAVVLMDFFMHFTLGLIDAVRDLPFAFYYIGDDLGSSHGPIISPAFIQKYWAPRMKNIIDAAHATGKPVMVHCCGDQSAVLPYLLEWGVSATHPIQPPVNDIYAMKERCGNRLTLVGNIDVAGVLSNGTPQEVYADTCEHIRRLGADGCYVVCSSHSIIDSVPPENYLAMVRAAHDSA